MCGIVGYVGVREAEPILVGRNSAKLEAISAECGGLPWTTNLDEALANPANPARPLPRLLRRLMPDPLQSFEGWQRFRHEDLADMTPAQKAWEAAQLRTAAALVEDVGCLPLWLLERLARLAV